MSPDTGANKPRTSPATQPETPELNLHHPEPPRVQVSVTLSSRQRSYFLISYKFFTARNKPLQRPTHLRPKVVSLQEQHALSREQKEKYFLDFVFNHAFFKAASPLSVAWEYLEAQKEVSKITAIGLKNLLENTDLMDRLKDAHFKLVLADPYYAGGVMLAYHFKIPVVLFGRWMPTEDIHFAIAPSPLSYVPVPHSRVTDRMGFVERFRNLVLYSLNEFTNQVFIYPRYDELCRRYLKTNTGTYDLYKKADIYLMKVDFVLEFPRPTMPNAFYAGGFQCRPPKTLRAEIQEFIDSSGEEGVMVFSLGNLVRTVPMEAANKLASAWQDFVNELFGAIQGRHHPHWGITPRF
ncbi:hypothetical protein NDU88_001692 [Pleurodeles waltl]|uniref:UDP-glucuronosyltransferase n=1 Tax=Pleurodeles waltl TaxID=8319 RepID=A0AAV7LYD2_PLEWA|nr:hypothetical protein NDU88_001692 [Pleurodeles waltl]